jgi:microcystin-dependent protein
MEGYIGEVRMFAGNFAPRSWAFCQGQSVSINSNTALFSLIGTTYGGDGVTTFNLPNLASRVPVGAGQGPGLSNRTLGEVAGSEYNTLNSNNIGSHSHGLTGSAGILVSGEDGHSLSPVGNYPAVNGDLIYSTTTDNSQMASANVSLTAAPAGSPNLQPIENIKPYLAMNFIICLDGIFPARN